MSERLPIITSIKNPQALSDFLKVNPGLIIIKLGAEWCSPCKRIERFVNEWYAKMPNNVYCCLVDIDACFELYGFFKSKRVSKGIPTILCYYKGNENYVPDDITVGSNEGELNAFFNRCLAQLKAQ